MYVYKCVCAGLWFGFWSKNDWILVKKFLQAPALESKLQESKAFILEQCLVLVSALQIGVEWLNI